MLGTRSFLQCMSTVAILAQGTHSAHATCRPDFFEALLPRRVSIRIGSSGKRQDRVRKISPPRPRVGKTDALWIRLDGRSFLRLAVGYGTPGPDIVRIDRLIAAGLTLASGWHQLSRTRRMSPWEAHGFCFCSRHRRNQGGKV